jgi:hypothetical protein
MGRIMVAHCSTTAAKLNMELKQQLVQAINILFHAQWLIETSGR